MSLEKFETRINSESELGPRNGEVFSALESGDSRAAWRLVVVDALAIVLVPEARLVRLAERERAVT